MNGASRRGLLIFIGLAGAVLAASIGVMAAGADRWSEAMLARSPSLLHEEALRLVAARQYAAALERLNAALARAPARHELHFLASACWQEIGDVAQSDREADLAIQHCPPHHRELWRYYYHRGFLENRLGHREQAIRDWAISVHRNPRNPTAYAELGRAYAARGDYAEARRQMREARRLDPSSAEYALRLGEYYMNDADWTAALALFEEALRLDASRHLAYRHAGYCAMQLARYGDAQYYFEQYQKERPADQAAAGWLRRVRQRLQK